MPHVEYIVNGGVFIPDKIDSETKSTGEVLYTVRLDACG